MEFIDVCKSLITKPRVFFRELRKEKTIKRSFLYHTVISLIYCVIIALFLLLFVAVLKAMTPADTESMPLYILALVVLGGFILSIGFNFLWTAILHVWIKIFGGSKGYKETYQLNVYSSIPSLVIGWFPFIGFAATVYSIYLLIIGTQEIHGITKTKSILMYVIPICVFVLLFIALYILLIAFMITVPNYMNATNTTG